MFCQNILTLLLCGTGFFTDAAGAVDGPIQNSESAKAPVYKAGETWTYRAVEKLPSGSSKSNLLNGGYELNIGQFGRMRAFALAQDQRIPLNQPRQLIYMLPTTQIIKQPHQYFRFPLAVGKTWPARGNRKTTADAQTSVTGIETVATLAGNFRAFRLERQLYIGKKL